MDFNFSFMCVWPRFPPLTTVHLVVINAIWMKIWSHHAWFISKQGSELSALDTDICMRVSPWVSSCSLCCRTQSHRGSATSYFSSCPSCCRTQSHRGSATSYFSSCSLCCRTQSHRGSEISYFSSCSLCCSIKAPRGFGTAYILLLYAGKMMSHTSTQWIHNVLCVTAFHREVDQEHFTSLSTVV